MMPIGYIKMHDFLGGPAKGFQSYASFEILPYPCNDISFFPAIRQG